VNTTSWDVVVASSSEIGERPLWDDRTGTFVWVDIPTGTVYRTRPGESFPWDTTSMTVGSTVGTAVLREVGGLAVATDGQIRFYDESGKVDAAPIDVDVPANAIFNDGMCDPAGRFVVGTNSDPNSPHNGLLFSVHADLSVHVLLTGVFESNGLDWSLDGRTMYYVDSFESVVRRYDYNVDTGELGSRGTDLVACTPDEGMTDGVIVDADGTIWVAFWEGSAIRRYSPTGELLEEHLAPVSKLTCPAFVGERLNTLVVTSAWQDLTDEQRTAEPWAGHVLSTHVNARGRLPFRFAGHQG
jgi:sugar lactone lactonase YvrE